MRETEQLLSPSHSRSLFRVYLLPLPLPLGTSFIEQTNHDPLWSTRGQQKLKIMRSKAENAA